MLCDPVDMSVLGPRLFFSCICGLSCGIRFRPLLRRWFSGFVFESDTQLPLCPLDWSTAGVLNSLVLNCVSQDGCLPDDSAFRRLPIRSPSGWVSSLFVYGDGYASEVTIMHWIGRRATGNNEHVWCSVPFLIRVISFFFWCGPIAAYGKGCSGETGG